MNLIPWRVKNLLSDNFPLLYHLAANIGNSGNSSRHWDLRLAQTWDSPRRHWPTKNALIADLAEPSHAILDIGCGNGGVLRHLHSLGYRNLHGLEISKYAIQRLRSEGINMHYGVLPQVPLPDASFDIVIASQVLEHVIRRRLLLSEIRRTLKPNGRALIFVPDNCLGPISEPEHVMKYDARSLERLLRGYFNINSISQIWDVNHPIPILFALAEKAAA